MPYLRRNAHGQITGLVDHPDNSDDKEASLTDPEVQAFLLSTVAPTENAAGQHHAQSDYLHVLQMVRGMQGRLLELEQSDLDFIRVLEDLIDLLVAKDLLLFSDLPAAAQKKLIDRRRLRDEQRDPPLIVEGGQIL